MRHELKTWPDEFEAIRIGEKNFDVRNNDRKYEVNDILDLREFDPGADIYLGRELSIRVTYIMRDNDSFIDLGDHVIMSIKPLRQSWISRLWNKIFDLN